MKNNNFQQRLLFKGKVLYPTVTLSFSFIAYASLTRDLKLGPLGTFTLKTSAFSNFDLRMSYSKLLNASSNMSVSKIFIWKSKVNVI